MIIKNSEQFLSPIKLNLFLEVINKTNDGYQITLEQLNVTKEQLSNPSIDDLPKILDSRMALTFPKSL